MCPKPARKHEAWTMAEKAMFSMLVPLLQRRYSAYMLYFPNRNYNQIKSYYHHQIVRDKRDHPDQAPPSYDSRMFVRQLNKMLNQQSAAAAPQPAGESQCQPDASLSFE